MSVTTPATGADAAAAVRPPRDELFRSLRPGIELRDDDPDGDGAAPTLFGHFARFNEWTEIDSWFEGRFLERIAPGAFRKTLREGSPKVLFNHGRDTTMGGQILGEPTVLREDDDGAYYEVRLFDGLPDLLMDGLRSGLYGASFRFRVLREELVQEPKRSDHNPQGLPERTIKEVELFEFGPVTFPAYPSATAGVRSITDTIIFDRLARDEDALRQLIEFRNGGAGAEPHPAGAESPGDEPELRYATADQDDELIEIRERVDRESAEAAASKDSAGAEPHPDRGSRVTRTPMYGVQPDTPSWRL